MALANQKTVLDGHEEGTAVREATAQPDLDIFAVDQAEQMVFTEAQRLLSSSARLRLLSKSGPSRIWRKNWLGRRLSEGRLLLLESKKS